MRRFLPCLVLAVLALAGCGTSAPQGENPPSVSFAGVAHESRLTKLPRRTGSPHVYRTVASPFVGEIFTATTGKWRNTPTSFAYQWERCLSGSCSAISGETMSTYTVAMADGGHRLRVAVTATNSFGSATAWSAETGEVPSSGCSSNCIFVAQSGKGAESGATCAAAHSLAWLNESKNWAASKTAGKVSPGMTAALCGSFTERMTVQESGTSGEPITLQFQEGAKIALPACPEKLTACLDTLGHAWIHVEGLSEAHPGAIEDTENGTGKKAEKTAGIDARGCEGCVFRFLEVKDMYVKTTLADSSAPTGGREVVGMEFYGSKVTIEHVTFHDDGWALEEFPGSTDKEVTIANDTFYNIDHGFAIATVGVSGGSIGPIIFAHNHLYGFPTWDTPEETDTYHHDGIHCYAVPEGDKPHYNGFYIYDNRIEEASAHGNSTAGIYIEGPTGPDCGDVTSNIWVFNNVINITHQSTESWDDGAIYAGAGEPHIYNNTIIGNEPTLTGAIAGRPCLKIAAADAREIRYKNNILTGCKVGTVKEATPTFASGGLDYNLYANGGGSANEYFQCEGSTYFFAELSKWQTCTGQDSHAKTATSAKVRCGEGACSTRAEYETSGALESGSPAKEAGVNLKASCETIAVTAVETACEQNILGEARPSTGAWNIGAY